MDFNADSNINPLTIFEVYHDAFGLGPSDSMKLYDVLTDSVIGPHIIHYKFQQYHKGYALEFGQFFIHCKTQYAHDGNGDIFRHLDVDTSNLLSAEEAFELATEYVHDSVYEWDYDSTLKPVPSLLIAAAALDETIADSFRVAYSIPIYGLAYGRTGDADSMIILDAKTGRILRTYPLSYDAGGGAGTSTSKATPPIFKLETIPNPADRQVQIRFTLPSEGDVLLECYDLLGNRIENLRSGLQPAGENVIPFDISTFSNGTYLLRLAVGNQVTTLRMIISR